MAKINKVVRISLSGGIIGLLFTNPRRALDNVIEQQNNQGWNCHQIMPHSSSNLFVWILRLIVLCCTLLLWTFGDGYLLLFEKEK